MAVRNCAEIGRNLQKIITRLMANDDLIKLLYYPSSDPISETNLTPEEKQQKVYNHLITIVPYVGQSEIERTILAITVENGVSLNANDEFKNVTFTITSIHPLTTWFIKGTNLRPFAVLGEIEKSLVNKTVDGLGKLVGGDFTLVKITDDVCIYEQTFQITSYD